MDKRVIFSVAGSGKTTLIVNCLEADSKALIVTYTENNLRNLRCRIIEKFNFMPKGIKVVSYFSFLHSFCYKPFLLLTYCTRGLSWKQPPNFTRQLERTNDRYYIDASRRLYHNRLAKFLDVKGTLPLVKERVEKYFESVFIDEVQDFAGHDFNFLLAVCKANVNFTLVGDYFQHTFDTSRDGATNKTLHSDFESYKKRFEKAGFVIDCETLSNSYRCSPTVCEFVTKMIGIPISSHRKGETAVSLIEDALVAEEKFYCNDTVKLFYQNHAKYSCYSQNWGGSKGQDCYKDVCLVLNNKSYASLKAKKLDSLPAKTKNKLYVACTRAKGDLYLVPEKLFEDHKQK